MPWTPKQHRFFEAVAHGMTPRNGSKLSQSKAKEMAAEGIQHKAFGGEMAFGKPHMGVPHAKVGGGLARLLSRGRMGGMGGGLGNSLGMEGLAHGGEARNYKCPACGYEVGGEDEPCGEEGFAPEHYSEGGIAEGVDEEPFDEDGYDPEEYRGHKNDRHVEHPKGFSFGGMSEPDWEEPEAMGGGDYGGEQDDELEEESEVGPSAQGPDFQLHLHSGPEFYGPGPEEFSKGGEAHEKNMQGASRYEEDDPDAFAHSEPMEDGDEEDEEQNMRHKYATALRKAKY